MSDTYFHQQRFDKGLSPRQLPAGHEYDDCTFQNCDFSEANFSSTIFSECVFTGCNLSNSRLTKTAFRNVVFKDCKMLGLHFEDCNPFGLSFRFESCVLDHSSFYNLNLPQTVFRKVSLREVEFSGSDFSKAVFESCDLLGANFDHTNLEKSDLRTSMNYRINPTTNKIRKAKFSIHGVAGLLSSFDVIID